MRILLADDHGLFVEGLGNLLQAGGFQVVGAAADGLEAVRLAREIRPDLILMDIRMPVSSGLEAARVIHAEMPEIRVVVLTTSSEDSDLYEALKCGASGYLLKNLKPDELFEYLHGLERGEAPLSPELAGRLLHEFARQAAALDELAEHPAGQTPAPLAETALSAELTPRQRQILTLVAEGQTYKEVGAAMYISENTVKYHMGEIVARLHLKNRAQAVAYALRSGLVSAQDG